MITVRKTKHSLHIILVLPLYSHHYSGFYLIWIYLFSFHVLIINPVFYPQINLSKNFRKSHHSLIYKAVSQMLAIAICKLPTPYQDGGGGKMQITRTCSKIFQFNQSTAITGNLILNEPFR